jgi:methylaspartate ammonia-lyase
MYFVPRYIKEMKVKGERLKYKCWYIDTITQLSGQKLSIKHGVDVIHSISDLFRANESRNTQFINCAQKLKALLVFADDSFLVS